jgi:hypothetical protein
VSADPSIVAGRKPGWFVVTDQGVVLSARFNRKPEAMAAHAAVVAGLRRELTREGRPGRFIAERVRAVLVRYGVLVGAWNGFRPLPEPAGSPGLSAPPP